MARILIKLPEEDRQALGAPESLPLEFNKVRRLQAKRLKAETGFGLLDLRNAFIPETEVDAEGNVLVVKEPEADETHLDVLVWLALLVNGIETKFEELDYDVWQVGYDIESDDKDSDDPKEQPTS